MQIVYEKNASISKFGASMYSLLEEPFYTHLGIEKPEDTGAIDEHDVKIAMGIGKHGKFLFIYSPSAQKKWQREQKKKEAGE